ncbi:1-acyl-sn-glycerol-3-phosphate acyltransferase [Pseudidiomarina piscicola]|uniref:1-acyl-sn-glycerol-3-phosphate acyltransferase n=1 Tax=Pseudidiomarina piscicola TaxID=2614830 RepID=A0A6S6WQE5_9GAMM|nr:lysophospholipid acyltransferase family protein [Pseudidiomarina piscicola]CAB0151579.1 1-acyl-sn-glycerol-3-phosphate acyltransferase [Pseudidiomarina piscicola]VZT41044.1 1-acyl-sn-glycerol-3-phosphate acyltransferase [Pseudomonas aeruginosa]
MNDVDQLIPPHLRAPFPTRGNRFSRWVGRVGMRVLGGWKVQGQLPATRQAIIPVAPHTSNWDFFVGVFVMLALGLNLSYLGKHTIFRFPVNGLLRWLGGIPLDRRSAQGVVGQMVSEFQQRGQLILALSPEGTRTKVKEWKRGFLHIAKAAHVPVVPVALDFAKKTVDICPPIFITGDIDSELARVKQALSHAVGKNPEHA